MKSLCVYLGATPGKSPLLKKTVIQLGRLLASQNIRLIYGGSSQGLMGVLAGEVKNCGGKITGIIPEILLPIEKPFSTLNELIITQTMQERKLLLQQQADAFMVLPGGLGTLEEAFETWNAIKIAALQKPIGFLNVNHYFDGLFSFISDCCQQGFITASQYEIPLISPCPKSLLQELTRLTYKVKPALPERVNTEQT